MKYKKGDRIRLKSNNTLEYFWNTTLATAIRAGLMFEIVDYSDGCEQLRIRHGGNFWTIIQRNYNITLVDEYSLPEELFEI